MLIRRGLFLLLIYLFWFVPDPVFAATRFWVGGTGTWDASDTTHWAATSGGAGGQSVPGSSDSVTFDGSSGGGTVTVNTNPSITVFTMGAFTGTIDFSVNNNNITVQSFSGTGTATRTLKMGNGTWTVTTGGSTPWDIGTITNLTFNAGNSTISLTGNGVVTSSFSSGALTYNNLVLGTRSQTPWFLSGGVTFTSITLTAPSLLQLSQSTTTTITTAAGLSSLSGNSVRQNSVASNSNTAAATISLSSGTPNIQWAGIKGVTFSGGATFSGTNSFDFGSNTGITITPPQALGAGGGTLIGG